MGKNELLQASQTQGRERFHLGDLALHLTVRFVLATP